MPVIFWLLAAVATINCGQVLQQHTLHLGRTSLFAWYWSFTAAVGLLTALILAQPAVALTPATISGMQYLAAILMLTPAVCMLGARRPGVSAWQWFVVLPMIFVLAWPAAIQIVNSNGRSPVQLSLPALSGGILAAIMSAAPGLGRGMTIPSLLQLTAALLAASPVIPLLAQTTWLFAAAIPVQLLSTILTGNCLRHHESQLQTATTLQQKTTILWLLFQDLYGMIWAQRLMQRAAEFERSEKWKCSLTIDGFTSLSSDTETNSAIADALPAFRWLLARFLDPQWVDTQLGISSVIRPEACQTPQQQR
jgi:hypothetical protein